MTDKPIPYTFFQGTCSCRQPKEGATTIEKSSSPLKKILLLGILAILLLAGIDAGLNALTGTADPEIKRIKGSKNGAVVVVFADSESSAQDLAQSQKAVLQKYGDIASVEYSQTNFDDEAISKKVHKQLQDWRYKRVIVLGNGLGAQVGTDLIDYDRANGRHFQFAAVFADAQTSVDDTEGSMSAAFFSWWYAGPMADFVGSKVSPGYPISGWTAQLRYANDHLGYRPDAYSGIPMAVVQSSNGKVKKEAATNWQQIFGKDKGKVIPVPESGKDGPIKAPKPWNGPLDKAFGLVA